MSYGPFRTDLRARGKLRSVASHLNRIYGLFNGMIGFDGLDVQIVDDEIRLFNRRAPGNGEGMDLSRFAFGWGAPTDLELADNQVWIAEGYVEGRYGYYRVPGAVVNVGGNAQSKTIIIVTGDQNGAVIEQNSVAENAFTGDTSHTFQRALYRVYLRDGKVVLDQVMAGVGGIVV